MNYQTDLGEESTTRYRIKETGKRKGQKICLIL